MRALSLCGCSGPLVVLIGDSHGSMYGDGERIVAEQSVNLKVISAAGRNPLPGSALYDQTLTFP